jgi:hypothetical protein
MSLRITKASRVRGDVEDGDGYGSRLAKLIPAEALGLYGPAKPSFLPIAWMGVLLLRLRASYLLVSFDIKRRKMMLANPSGKRLEWRSCHSSSGCSPFASQLE